MFSGFELDVDGRRSCMTVRWNKQKGRGGEWKTISLPSNHPVYWLGNKKGESRKDKKERSKKRASFVSCRAHRCSSWQLCSLRQDWVSADVECEPSLLGTECCLWWELSSDVLLSCCNFQWRQYIQVALWVVDCLSQAWLITHSSRQSSFKR